MCNKDELVKVYLKSLNFKTISFKNDKVFYVESNDPYWYFYDICNEIYVSDRFVTEISTIFNINSEKSINLLKGFLIGNFPLKGIFMGIKKIKSGDINYLTVS